MMVKSVISGIALAAVVAAGHSAYAATIPATSPTTTTQQLMAQHPVMQQSLSYGSSGHWVMTLQADLNLLGYHAGPMDGVYGPKTQAGVKAFQRAHSLSVTGSATPATWQDILAGFHIVPPVSHSASSVVAVNPTAKTIDGRPVLAQYQVMATAYGPSLRDNYPYGPTDAFGQPLQSGMIAVDPSLIPLKSTVYVAGYHDTHLPSGGFLGHAMDTGGAIKGYRIDIFMNSSSRTVSNFGIQPVTVYVLGK